VNSDSNVALSSLIKGLAASSKHSKNSNTLLGWDNLINDMDNQIEESRKTNVTMNREAEDMTRAYITNDFATEESREALGLKNRSRFQYIIDKSIQYE